MANDQIGISASYDATIILWDLAKRSMSEKLIGPHKEAIMDFEWANSLLVSGDKSGVVAIWVRESPMKDLNKCKMIKAMRTHKGSVSSIKFHAKQGLISTAGLNVHFTDSGWSGGFVRHAD
jgi:WD40 repeat protein